jgi:hypothetical protein
MGYNTTFEGRLDLGIQFLLNVIPLLDRGIQHIMYWFLAFVETASGLPNQVGQ